MRSSASLRLSLSLLKGHVLTPFPRYAQAFPLSAGPKRGNKRTIRDLLPLLCDSREGGWGDEYV